MKIIFWQNIISPHQVDFLKALSLHHEILLIVEEIQDIERKKDHWEIPQYNYLKIIIAPPLNSLDQYFENAEDIHIFSGISAYKTVYSGFKKAEVHKAKIGIVSEPINFDGIKGFLKLIRGNFQRLKYGHKIKFIAATGDLGITAYTKFGYRKNKLFQWGYFVDHPLNNNVRKKNQIVFVGQLTDRKQILQLTNLLIENNCFGYNEFLILGVGPDLSALQNIINSNKADFKISILGRKSKLETIEIIAESKLLFLPSLFDGWGVVVNEALLAGTPVITSDNVGAKILVENSDRGAVFKAGDYDQLKKLLENWSTKNYVEKDYLKIQNWAVEKITPAVAADYFSKIISCTFDKNVEKEKPIAPWVQKQI